MSVKMLGNLRKNNFAIRRNVQPDVTETVHSEATYVPYGDMKAVPKHLIEKSIIESNAERARDGYRYGQYLEKLSAQLNSLGYDKISDKKDFELLAMYYYKRNQKRTEEIKKSYKKRLSVVSFAGEFVASMSGKIQKKGLADYITCILEPLIDMVSEYIVVDDGNEVSDALGEINIPKNYAVMGNTAVCFIILTITKDIDFAVSAGNAFDRLLKFEPKMEDANILSRLYQLIAKQEPVVEENVEDDDGGF